MVFAGENNISLVTILIPKLCSGYHFKVDRMYSKCCSLHCAVCVQRTAVGAALVSVAIGKAWPGQRRTGSKIEVEQIFHVKFLSAVSTQES